MRQTIKTVLDSRVLTYFQVVRHKIELTIDGLNFQS